MKKVLQLNGDEDLKPDLCDTEKFSASWAIRTTSSWYYVSYNPSNANVSFTELLSINYPNT